jgi:hypothetical protein
MRLFLMVLMHHPNYQRGQPAQVPGTSTTPPFLLLCTKQWIRQFPAAAVELKLGSNREGVPEV